MKTMWPLLVGGILALGVLFGGSWLIERRRKMLAPTGRETSGEET